MLPKENRSAKHDAVQDRRRAERRTASLKITGGNRELETALLVSQSLAQHNKLEDLILQTLNRALEAVNAESGSILLSDLESHHLVCYRSIGEKPMAPGSVLQRENGIAGAVLKSAQHAVVVDAEKDGQLPDRIDRATGSLMRNMVILPLKRWQGEPIGVMEILNKRSGGFDDDDVAVLTMICSLATPAIEEARLFEAKKLAEVAELAGDMSHDIKNLLMPVLCGADVLRDELDELFGKLSDRGEPHIDKSRTLCHEVWIWCRRTSVGLQIVSVNLPNV